jgi:2-desacetyl-2-hydroxyethyl bacteriochlorophyllide A dehydrogenase
MSNQAIVLTAPNHLELQELPLPEPGVGEVRIRTKAVGICATDLVMIAGDPRVKLPALLGHEWSGVVDATGAGVDPALVGKPCVAYNVRPDGGEVGFEHPGAYGETFVTDANNLQLLPANVPFSTAALCEPLAVALRGLRRMAATNLENVLLFGDGPLGLILLMLLKRNGFQEITVVGSRSGRLAMAVTLGASSIVDYHQHPHHLAEILLQEHGRRFANVIEVSGSPQALRTSWQVAANDGRILVIGDYGEASADFPWNHLLHYELHFIGSNASEGCFAEAVYLVSTDQLPLDTLITQRFPVTQYTQAFELVKQKDPSMIKVVLEWE